MSRLKFVQHTDDVCAAQFVVFGDINSVRIPKVLDKSDLLKAVIRTTELYLLILSDTIDDLT